MDTPPLSFRPATRDDVPGVVALLVDDMLGRAREGGDLAPYLAAFDAMQAEPGNTLFVAQHGGRIIACYQLVLMSGLSLAGTRRAEIEGIRVAADLRGRGLGAQLIADAEARARAAGCGLVQFTTNAARSDAHRFYRRLGFTPSHIGFKKPL
ncbi:GNAT family N-acetyltransferase [Paracoccus luteus]|uniref:GNAT family N-acetyltransferase n=1 Tax=Paracoccus luteus TaxID=2508543 RepID=UPI001FEBAD70|nr:GNAT family N-acetyltransferase [Paracoccus luteus]